MRKLTLFSTLLCLWISGACVSQGADSVTAPTVVHADWTRHQVTLVKEGVVANDLEGATTLVVNAAARVETTPSTVGELTAEVTKALIDHDELLRLVAIVGRKYPALAVSIARGAAAPHLARGIGFASGYGAGRAPGIASDPRASSSLIATAFGGIPAFTSINPTLARTDF